MHGPEQRFSHRRIIPDPPTRTSGAATPASEECAARVAASLSDMPFETAAAQWDAGLRRLADAPRDQRPTLERVTRLIEDELRRRLGGPFTTDELAELYDEGAGWASDLAYEAAPEQPYAWDMRVVCDAAFARYLRSATDYAGGRRVE
jgi:hypothetical protein